MDWAAQAIGSEPKSIPQKCTVSRAQNASGSTAEGFWFTGVSFDFFGETHLPPAVSRRSEVCRVVGSTV